MKHIVQLVAAYEDDVDQWGLRLRNLGRIPDGMLSVAGQGLLIAHDLIEHQRGPEYIGGAADEMLALGGIWFTRGKLCDMSRTGVGSMFSPEDNIAAEYPQILRGLLADQTWGPGFHEYVNTEVECTGDEWSVAEIHKKGMHLAEQEFDEDGWDGDLQPWMEELRTHGPALIQAGINLAYKRFENPINANNLFWNIANELDPIIKEVQVNEMSYGEWELTWDDESHEVTVVSLLEEEEYDDDEDE